MFLEKQNIPFIFKLLQRNSSGLCLRYFHKVFSKETSVSLLLSHIQGYCYHLSKFHIYALVYCIGVFLSVFLFINWWIDGSLQNYALLLSSILLLCYSTIKCPIARWQSQQNTSSIISKLVILLASGLTIKGVWIRASYWNSIKIESVYWETGDNRDQSDREGRIL